MKQTILEIRQQYEALSKTLALFDAKLPRLRAEWTENPPRALVFLGCGSSYMVACSLRDIAAAWTDIPVSAMAAGDLWLNHARYRRQLSGALVVAISRSGRTSEILHAIEALRNDNVNFRLFSLAATEKSPLAALSQICMELPWAFDESVCQTRSVSNLYAAGICLLAGLTGRQESVSLLGQLTKAGPEYLERAEKIMQGIASQPWNKAVVLTDGECAGLSAEGALAFQEIAQVPACQHHVLDVRHGPMVLIDSQTLVLVYLYPDGQPQQEALLNDLRKKGALIVAYANLPREISGAECVGLGLDVGIEAGGIAFLALCQLAAYCKSAETGSDPDAPDGLDPWIQVN